MTQRKFGIITTDERLLEVGSPEYEEAIERKSKWESYFPSLEWLESEVQAFKEEYGSSLFKPHLDQGWYFERMLAGRRMLEGAIEKGDAAAAAMEAVELGQLMAESRIKFEWEQTALWGESRLSESRDAAQARRKRSAEVRFHEVEKLKAQGKSQNNAFQIVARKEGSHAKTVEADYYKHKKTRTE